ncbi:sulfite reductase flavoprotein subunit alpha [Microbacterium sp. YJN-G]|jgi:sulfite reductase (NADPH) flavoprotein alpha-component|uniref:diflavin oxidoreductase n=2 Tax=unclassified Microbacterium TaxID=2609290 RepID=UPI001878E490|nr:sulfite reductase flavoprotein subunit alpha [Microbacterium sp. YJN-G]
MTIQLSVAEGEAKMAASDAAELTILFGSQTGNAEYLAFQIHGKVEKAGNNAQLASLEDWLHSGDRQLQRLLVVTSTHDNGHMPDNAAEFWDWLQQLPAGAFEGLPYAVLSIGDSMYEDFCKAGHDIDQRLEELGAARIVESIDCDIDFEFSAERWAKPAVQQLLDTQPWDGAVSADSEDPGQAVAEKHTASDRDRTARVVATQQLSKPGSAKYVAHYELAFDEPFTYAPGDSLSVFPKNSDRLVSQWIDVFGEQTIDGRAFRDILKHDVELRLPHPGLIVGLSRLQPDNNSVKEIIDLIQSGSRERLDAWLWGRDVLDVITDLGCESIPAADVLAELRPLQHRDYSISSSPLLDDGRLHITVAGVKYERDRGEHQGTATEFLRERAEDGAAFTVRRVPAHEFTLPADDQPVIMIGPGVGVAPFRAFLRHRDASGASGSNWLFFGDQHRAFDWLYEDEFEDLRARGVLDRLDVAFSRDQAEKLYVQHVMLDHADQLREWVDGGAYIFVCGDKTRMAADVDRALVDILGAGDSSAGEQRVADLKAAGRYVKDVY